MLLYLGSTPETFWQEILQSQPNDVSCLEEILPHGLDSAAVLFVELAVDTGYWSQTISSIEVFERAPDTQPFAGIPIHKLSFWLIFETLDHRVSDYFCVPITWSPSRLGTKKISIPVSRDSPRLSSTRHIKLQVAWNGETKYADDGTRVACQRRLESLPPAGSNSKESLREWYLIADNCWTETRSLVKWNYIWNDI